MRKPITVSSKRVCKNQYTMQYQEEKQQEEEDDAKWLTHYCSDHEILLVGEGDFSFSLCLAKAFGSASNIVASSLDTYGKVTKKYKNSKSNLDELQKLGACLLHGIDATKMKFYPDLRMRRFDRIIFNFPHAGFHGKEDDLALIKMHRDLVFGFFKNASGMLRPNGEIHVNHKTTPPFDYWSIEKLAMQGFLILIECTDFVKEDYPGYNNKRGDGSRCDLPFPLGKCSTFKFINNPRALRINRHTENPRKQTIFPFREVQNFGQFPPPINVSYYPQPNEPVRPEFELRNGYNPISGNYFNNGTVASSADLRNGYTPISMEYFNNVKEIHGRVACSDNLIDRYTPISSNYFDNGKEIHGRVSCSADFRNGYTPIQRYSYYFNNVTEMQGRVACSARDVALDSQRPLPPIDSLQSLQTWPTSTNCRYSLTDPLRRNMDIDPFRRTRENDPLGARNEGYQYQFSGVGSRYFQDELCRIAERPSCFEFDRTRPDFERYNADVPRRTWNSEMYVM